MTTRLPLATFVILKYFSDMSNRYNRLFVDLIDSGAEFIVAGGVAAVLQGVERVTLDLDISLNFESESVEGFLSVMQNNGLTPLAPLDPAVIADSEQRRSIVNEKNAIVFTFRDLHDPFWHIDVFLTSELSYEELKSSCDLLELDERKILVLSKQKLLELKRSIDPPRPKDKMDIEELTKLIEERK